MMKLALTDPRFAPEKDQSSDQLSVQSAGAQPIDSPPAPMLQYRQVGNIAYFSNGELRPGAPHEIGVQIDGDNLVFYPERSSAQKRLLLSIGIEA